MQVLLLAVLLGNILVLGRSLNLFRLPGERNELAMAKESCEILVSHVERWADEQGLGTLAGVQDLLARLNHDISRARSMEELAQVMIAGSASARDTLDREQDGKRRAIIETLINKDPAIAQVHQKVSVTVSNEQGKGVVINDEAQILSDSTLQEIKAHPLCSADFSAIVVDIQDGKAKVANYRTLYDHMKVLQQETQALQAELRRLNSQMGYNSMTGPGVVVKLYDSPGGFTDQYIVHDADIRDVVNELYAAGAMGVAVGEQRLTVTFHSLCRLSRFSRSKPIMVNPVVIEAVGDARCCTAVSF